LLIKVEKLEADVTAHVPVLLQGFQKGTIVGGLAEALCE
jgi:hypothetical protein